MSITANAVIIGKRSKNYGSITATTVTIAAGGTNMSAGAITAQNTTIVGTNEGAVTGTVVLNGGSNTNTATITGNLTINSGSSAAAVTGDVRLAGGSNTGAVSGNLYVLSATASNVASVSGNIIVATTVTNLVPVLPSDYSGSVIQVLSGELTTTTYVQGSAVGSPSATDGTYYNLDGDSKVYTYNGANKNAVNGTFYDLQGDSKAYTYTNGTGQLFSGPAFNLTGDSKAYSWADGVKGSLYSGSIGSDSYTNGELDVATSVSYTVTGDVTTLYTASGGSVTVGPVYTDSGLTVAFTGFFAYNNTDYYSDSGTPNTYRAWPVSNASNYVSLYTIPAGDILTSTVYVQSNIAAGDEYTGTVTYNGNNYYSASGTLQNYRAWTVTEASVGGTLYTQPFDSVTENASYTTSGLNTQYVGKFIYDDVLYRTDESAGATGEFSGAVFRNNTYFSVSYGQVSASYASGIVRLFNDNLYYFFSGTGASDSGVLFTGAYYNSSTYLEVSSGEILSNGKTGVAQLINDGLVYTFSEGGAVATVFSGVYQYSNGYMYSVASGNSTGSYASGIQVLGNNNKFYNFDGAGGGTFFTGVYYTGSNYYNVDNGQLTATGATGIRKLANDGLYYTFYGSENNIGTVFNGAFYDGTSYYSVVIGEVTVSYANNVQRLINDSKFYIFDGLGNPGVLFNGTFKEGAGYDYAVDAGVLSSDYASGVRQSSNDGLVYTFDNGVSQGNFTGRALVRDNRYYNIDDGVLGELFNGVGYFVHPDTGASGYWYITNGVFVDSNIPEVRMLASDGLYYSFPADGSLPNNTFSGAYNFFGSFYTITAGVREATASFTGAWYDATQEKYCSVVNGVPNDLARASGVRLLASNNSYYNFTGDGTLPASKYTGIVEIAGYWYHVTDGARETTASFTGAWHNGNNSYYNIDNGSLTGNNAAGIRMLVNDGLYYNFPGSGSGGTALNGVRATTVVLGETHDGYKDGALYIEDGIVSFYEASCDAQPSDNGLAILTVNPQFNVEDKVLQVGTVDRDNNFAVSWLGAKAGGFAYLTTKLSFDDGKISSIANCDEYAAD